MGLTEDVVATACAVATSGASQIAACARGGASCEGWLKVELSHALGALPGVAVATEVGNVDLTVRRGGEIVLCELKTFPTNYGRAGKPITNFIGGVVRDLEKLASRTDDGTRGLAIWMSVLHPRARPASMAGALGQGEASGRRTALRREDTTRRFAVRARCT
jgi:hypothetical protein